MRRFDHRHRCGFDSVDADLNFPLLGDFEAIAKMKLLFEPLAKMLIELHEDIFAIDDADVRSSSG